jgi:hypothetical protein
MIKEEHITSPNPTMKTSPTIKLVSPFSIQTKVSNSEIDQTIDDVINGKGDILINDLPHAPPKPQQQQQLQPQPSSQLVWVQNGTVTTKTWLSPLYQKQQQQQQQHQQQQQSDYDPIGSTLTHQDVVNIAQQVVFPTTTEQNQMNTVLQPPPANNSKKRNRSKSTTNTTPKRTRNRKVPLNRPHSTTTASSQQDIIAKPLLTSPITPTLNLINKPMTWSNISTSGSVTNKTNSPMLNSDQHLSSYDKNDSWPAPCIENVDSMLDEFQLVSIDEQRINSNHPLDFDLSTDGFSSKANDRFGSSTPPPPSLSIDNQRFSLSSTEKFLNPSITNSRLITGDLDGVYEHFLNPYSSSMWQENQVTSSVTTPPDFQLNHFPMHQQQQQHHQQQQQHQHHQQQYYSPQTNDEQFDPYNMQSQVRLLFDVQS